MFNIQEIDLSTFEKVPAKDGEEAQWVKREKRLDGFTEETVVDMASNIKLSLRGLDDLLLYSVTKLANGDVIEQRYAKDGSVKEKKKNQFKGKLPVLKQKIKEAPKKGKKLVATLMNDITQIISDGKGNEKRTARYARGDKYMSVKKFLNGTQIATEYNKQGLRTHSLEKRKDGTQIETWFDDNGKSAYATETAANGNQTFKKYEKDGSVVVSDKDLRPTRAQRQMNALKERTQRD